MKRWFTSFVIIMVLGLAHEVFTAPGVLHENLRKGLMPWSPGCAQVTWRAGARASHSRPAASLQATGAPKSQPLSRKQLLELIAAGVPNQRVAELVRDRGIDFEVDDDYVSALRRAGANDLLITVVRKASAPVGVITVETAPNAQVFLDGNPLGTADSLGVLVARARLGSHALKISLAGKQDFGQTVTIAEGSPTRVVAPLADVAGSLRVKGSAGASVWLDNSLRGTIGASQDLLLSGIPAGTHALRVSARGKVDDARNVAIASGQEAVVEAVLADGAQVNPQDGLRYVWIAPGSFMMGCSPGDNDCAGPEKPAREVALRRAFWIGQTEVTVGAYKRFVKAAGQGMPPEVPKFYHGWSNDTLPMVNVNWGEASQYCAWAGGRLPTEAEWEYAARGGSTQARYGSLSEIAWCKENARSQTHPVATKLANGYGLYDILGNVWEWVNDWYDPNSYQGGAAQDPHGPTAGQEKVLRGGSWIVDSKLLRVSDRYSIRPNARSDFFGFRCVWRPRTP